MRKSLSFLEKMLLSGKKFFHRGIFGAGFFIAGCPYGNFKGDETTESKERIVVPVNGPGMLMSRVGDTYEFSQGGQSINQGDFLISVVNGGFLRKAESVSTSANGNLIVKTSFATIAEAVESGSFTFLDTPEKGVEKSYKIITMSRTFENEQVSEDYPISLNGNLNIDLKFNLDFDIAEYKLTDFLCSVEGDADVELSAKFSAEGNKEIKPIEREILKKQWYLSGFVGGVPVVVEVTGRVNLGAEADLEGKLEFEAGCTGKSLVSIGAEYHRGEWKPVSAQSFIFEPIRKDWCISGSGNARAYIKPEFDVQVYGVLGPTLALEPYANFDANGETCLSEGSYEWELSAGVKAPFSMKADIFDKEMKFWESDDLFDGKAKWVIAGGSEDKIPSGYYGNEEMLKHIRIARTNDCAFSGGYRYDNRSDFLCSGGMVYINEQGLPSLYDNEKGFIALREGDSYEISPLRFTVYEVRRQGSTVEVLSNVEWIEGYTYDTLSGAYYIFNHANGSLNLEYQIDAWKEVSVNCLLTDSEYIIHEEDATASYSLRYSSPLQNCCVRDCIEN